MAAAAMPDRLLGHRRLYRWAMGAEDSSRKGRFAEVYAQAQAARLRAQELTRQLQATQAQVRATRAKVQAECQRMRAAQQRARQIRELWLAPDPERLRYSAHARLQAQLASMPVIEQAKGIIMAQCGWDANQAFDAMRRVSQQENIKVRELAAQIVAHTLDSAQRQAGTPQSTRRLGGDGTVGAPGTVVVPLAEHRRKGTIAG